ncbi:copper chaperone PCu(A)C [Modestobacter sp. NPDC049651]|uniref:copper chaperone PCu(A)C n=1 Tax=unclassified Modestobacter TaxID=2643866 RepID=UPI0033D4314B
MNRAVRAAAIGVLVLSPVALSACSAGQVSQTATQQRAKNGGEAAVGNITVREARLAYPSTGSYPAGADAQLLAGLVNAGDEDDVLTDVSGDDFSSATITPAPAGAAATATGAVPTGQTAPPPSVSGGELTVPADGNVYLGGNGAVVTLNGLTKELTVGQHITLTLTFERAGSVDVTTLVSTPTRGLPRETPFDFNPTEADEQRGGGAG